MKSRCRRSTTIVDPTVESFSSNSGAETMSISPRTVTISVVPMWSISTLKGVVCPISSTALLLVGLKKLDSFSCNTHPTGPEEIRIGVPGRTFGSVRHCGRIDAWATSRHVRWGGGRLQ